MHTHTRICVHTYIYTHTQFNLCCSAHLPRKSYKFSQGTLAEGRLRNASIPVPPGSVSLRTCAHRTPVPRTALAPLFNCQFVGFST